MPKYSRGTVLRFTYEHELAAPLSLKEEYNTLYLGDLYVELGAGSTFKHIEVVSVPEPEWRSGDVVRDPKGVTWCRAAGVKGFWYMVHNHPAVVDDTYAKSEDGAYVLVPHGDLKKPLTPLLRNGYVWDETNE